MHDPPFLGYFTPRVFSLIEVMELVYFGGTKSFFKTPSLHYSFPAAVKVSRSGQTLGGGSVLSFQDLIRPWLWILDKQSAESAAKEGNLQSGYSVIMNFWWRWEGRVGKGVVISKHS